MARTDILIVQGDDFSTTFIPFDTNGLPLQMTDDGTLAGAPFTAAAQLRRSNADADPTIDATFGCTVEPVGSRVTIALNAATTLGLTNGPYQFDVEITNPTSGAVKTIASGRASVQLEVTR